MKLDVSAEEVRTILGGLDLKLKEMRDDQAAGRAEGDASKVAFYDAALVRVLTLRERLALARLASAAKAPKGACPNCGGPGGGTCSGCRECSGCCSCGDSP